MKHGKIFSSSLIIGALAAQSLLGCGPDETTVSGGTQSGGSSNASTSGSACSIPTWDVTYEITGNFMITGTTLSLGDGTHPIGPGSITLRFPDSGGAPATGAIQVLAYNMPIQFSSTTSGLTVDTDVTTSAGPNGCGVASGKLVDTKLQWDSCMYNALNGDSTTSWTPDDAANGPGCISGYKSVGTVTCSSTNPLAQCSQGNLMDGENKQDETWNQPLNTFIFTADLKTFTMGGEGGPPIEKQKAPQSPAVETPNRTPSYTWFNLQGAETARVQSCGCSE